MTLKRNVLKSICKHQKKKIQHGDTKIKKKNFFKF